MYVCQGIYIAHSFAYVQHECSRIVRIRVELYSELYETRLFSAVCRIAAGSMFWVQMCRNHERRTERD